MNYTDNPVLDAERHYTRQEEQLNKQPKCSYCGKRIQTEKLCVFDDEVICLSCLDEHFIKWTDDYLE